MKKWLMAAVLLASLAACNNGGGGNSSISDYIARLIGTSSCENNTPVDVNSARLNLEEETEVNVNNVTPQCG